MSLFRPAVVADSWLRLALAGPSKTGKSMSSLEIATELITLLTKRNRLRGNGRIAAIDTEHGSLNKYARYFKFDSVGLSDFHPQNYIKLMMEAQKEGYSVLIVDSSSHEWSGKGGILELHAKQVPLTPKNNSWAAWAKITPLHNAFIECFLSLDMHVICTMRARDKLMQRDGEIVSVGTRAVQRKDMMFEFDAMGMITYDHKIKFGGTRCLTLTDREFAGEDLKAQRGPGKPIAESLADWLTEGADNQSSPVYGELPHETAAYLEEIRIKAGITDQQYQTILIQNGASTTRQLSEAVANTLIRRFQGKAIHDQKLETIDHSITPKSEPTQVKPQPAEYNPEKLPITDEQIKELAQLMSRVEPDARERGVMMNGILNKRHVSRIKDLTIMQGTEIIGKLKDILTQEDIKNQFDESLKGGNGQPEPEQEPENTVLSKVPNPPKAQPKPKTAKTTKKGR